MQSQANSSLHPMELSNKKDKIFASCLEKAETSNLLFRHGCIATYSGKVIAKGCNTYNNYSRDMFFNNSCSCHAEINVLRQIYYNTKKKRKLNKIMKKTTLYISRCSTMHASADSAPCIDCLKMIKKLNVKKMVFNLNEKHYVMNPKNYYSEHKTMGRQRLEKIDKFTKI